MSYWIYFLCVLGTAGAIPKEFRKEDPIAAFVLPFIWPAVLVFFLFEWLEKESKKS